MVLFAVMSFAQKSNIGDTSAYIKTLRLQHEKNIQWLDSLSKISPTDAQWLMIKKRFIENNTEVYGSCNPLIIMGGFWLGREDLDTLNRLKETIYIDSIFVVKDGVFNQSVVYCKPTEGVIVMMVNDDDSRVVIEKYLAKKLGIDLIGFDHSILTQEEEDENWEGMFW